MSASPPQRIFLSHASADREPANLLCRALEERGRACWIAPRDVAGGLPYAGQITRAIRDAEALLVVFSGATGRSEHVLREIDLAANVKVPVVAVRLEEVAPSDELAFYLGKDHWVDALHPPIDAHVARIDQALRNVAAARAVVSRPSEPWRPPREKVLAELSSDLARYQDLTLKLKATLEEATQVLAGDPAARTTLLGATLAYNEFAPAFVARLAEYRASIRKYWGVEHLTAFDAVQRRIDTGIYRGALYGLNPVRADLNEILSREAPDERACRELDARKREPLARLQEQLDDLRSEAAGLLASLEHAS